MHFEQHIADANRYECKCVENRIGVRCEETMSEACQQQQQQQGRQQACHNGGVCVADQQYQAGRCLCPSGFTGHFCELDIDDCASQPCVNGLYYSRL